MLLLVVIFLKFYVLWFSGESRFFIEFLCNWPRGLFAHFSNNWPQKSIGKFYQSDEGQITDPKFARTQTHTDTL